MLILNMTISGTIWWAHRLGAEPADPEIRAGSSDRAAFLRGAHSSSRNVSLMKHAIRPFLAAAHTSETPGAVKPGVARLDSHVPRARRDVGLAPAVR
jgi:hypothetical protein